jgi:hypothetical protein
VRWVDISLLIYGRFRTKSDIEENRSMEASVSYSGLFGHRFSSDFIIGSDLITSSLRGTSNPICLMAYN